MLTKDLQPFFNVLRQPRLDASFGALSSVGFGKRMW